MVDNFQTENSKFSLNELALRAQTDTAAAAELMARIMPSVRSLARTIEPDLSDDLLQEGLMAALVAVEHFDPDKGSAETFFVQCAKNKMLSSVRRFRPINNAGEETLEKIPADTENREKRFGMLYSAIEQCLSDLERETVLMYLEGRSYRETAEQLGVSEKSVDNAMQRARRKLRDELEDRHN